MRIKLSIICALAALSLAGCTGLLDRVTGAANGDASTASKYIAASEHGDIQAHPIDDVVVNNGIWLSGRTVKLASDAKLPPLFSQPATFDRSVFSLQEFAERVTRLTSIPTKVAPDAVDAAARALASASGAAPTNNRSGPTSGIGLQPPLPPAHVGGNNGAGLAPLHIAYNNGDLKGLLDAACAQFGVYWRFANGMIDFYFTDTRNFQVSAVPGDSSLNANVVSTSSNDNGSSGSGGGGLTGGTGGAGGGSSGSGTGVSSSNTSSTIVNSQLSIFTSLQTAIKAMLSPYGSVVSSPATGSLSVTDTPDVLDRVARFMDEQNRTMSRQVLINVTVLSVTLSAQDSYGIDWGAVYQALGTRFGLSNTFATTATNPVAFSASVITPNSRASGTQAMISALSTQGTVRRKTSASITTLNNQPVPVQVATQVGYLASISTTNTANVGSSTSLTPGTVTTGFNMTLLPHILDDGTVLLQFYTNLSALDALQTVSSGGTNPLQIQTPEIDTRNFLQRVSMKSGETLVISGYEGTNDNSTKQGTGTPSNYALGGGFQASRSREVIVILITPIAMPPAGT